MIAMINTTRLIEIFTIDKANNINIFFTLSASIALVLTTLS